MHSAKIKTFAAQLITQLSNNTCEYLHQISNVILSYYCIFFCQIFIYLLICLQLITIKQVLWYKKEIFINGHQLMNKFFPRFVLKQILQWIIYKAELSILPMKCNYTICRSLANITVSQQLFLINENEQIWGATHNCIPYVPTAQV